MWEVLNFTIYAIELPISMSEFSFIHQNSCIYSSMTQYMYNDQKNHKKKSSLMYSCSQSQLESFKVCVCVTGVKRTREPHFTAGSLCYNEIGAKVKSGLCSTFGSSLGDDDIYKKLR